MFPVVKDLPNLSNVPFVDQQKSQKLKIAVVLPVFNTATYLRECIESLLQQTYANFVIFAVDDGSTDKSSAILDEYSKEDIRLRVWHLNNGGVSRARNFALEQIEREGGFHYVAFCDSDDVVTSDFLQLYVYGATTFNAQFITIGYLKFDKQGVVRRARKKLMHAPILLEGESLQEFCLSLHPESRNLPSSAYFLNNVALSATCIQGLRFDEERVIGEDAEYRFQAIHRIKRGVVLSNIGYMYRLRKSSLSSRVSLSSLYSDLELYLGWLDHRGMIRDNIAAKVKRLLVKKFQEAIILAYEDGSLHEYWDDFCVYYNRIRKYNLKSVSRKTTFLIFALGPMVTGFYLWLVRFGKRPRREKLEMKMRSAFD